jgi:superfamily II DNA or RNA helicase
MTLQSGDQVAHRTLGVGRIMMLADSTAVVRFDSGIQEVLLAELSAQTTVLQALRTGQHHAPQQAQQRVQAELISSLNDTWGVFSRSRIALLPHQLWVCKQVLDSWPPRWLIADDVGLGKTVEAGLILWPLLSRRQVVRLLIIAPASLTGQWQHRMKKMFDLNLTVYDASQDHEDAREGTTYWDIHNQVIVSLQTLRDDHKGRHARLLAADAWDLILVDEAHHLNVDEATGATLGFELLEKLQKAEKIGGLLLFAATPHRGKDYGFLSLLELLRPDLFSANEEMASQLKHLSKVVIRNNKQTVTDLQGQRLFQVPVVTSEEYAYSPEEATFYERLTDFITTGQTYAASLGNTANSQAVMLVLIALQKLASSSVAAIRRALRSRAARLKGEISKADARTRELTALQEAGDTEGANALEELVGLWSGGLQLMTDEKERLEELLELADQVVEETKIRSIMTALEARFPGRSVLFFTEYKATQSLLLEALTRAYGEESVTFINGDDRADDVLGGTLRTIRDRAATEFNEGKRRFLVSTEAAGEGIDLQQSCHTLIHVDLPWNPMRLHQRVGRLNRYGQTRQVEVLSFRNPGTVEARIWDKLNTKIGSIMRAFAHVMDEPEDLLQLVLGMTSPRVFENAFSGAARQGRNLDEWFDRTTSQFGGRDVLNTVQELIGYSTSFDYQQVSDVIPRVDLPDLIPFFRQALRLNQRLVDEQGDLLAFKTPEAWLGEVGILRNYRDLGFNRALKGNDVAGVGHKVVDRAVAQARKYSANVAVAAWAGLDAPLYVFRIADRVTNTPGVRRTLVGRLMGDQPSWLRDWELLQLLNTLKAGSDGASDPGLTAALADMLEDETRALETKLPELNLGYAAPLIEPYAVFAPQPQ